MANDLRVEQDAGRAGYAALETQVRDKLEARARVESGTRARVESETRARVELAAVYRLCAHFGWENLIYNHAAMRAPGEDCFLVKPHDLMFSEVCASDLVKLRLDGKAMNESQNINAAGFTIHTAVLNARAEINCTIHVHTEPGLAMGARKSRLAPMYQGAMQFFNRLSYHDYEGIASDLDETTRIARDLGPRNKAMILRNHGLLTCGTSAADALSVMRYLVQACDVQLRLEAAGADMAVPSDEVCEHTARQWERSMKANEKTEWAAQLRILDRLYPSYKN
ncbi:MAG: class II aldolase/adducin family protein [Betaproteobacteria bacterium]|nr:class II aldolase/adducin family protein [Betaproteobacteria bacterium]